MHAALVPSTTYNKARMVWCIVPFQISWHTGIFCNFFAKIKRYRKLGKLFWRWPLCGIGHQNMAIIRTEGSAAVTITVFSRQTFHNFFFSFACKLLGTLPKAYDSPHVCRCRFLSKRRKTLTIAISPHHPHLSLIHIWRCRRIERCRSRWSPYH